MQMLKSRLLSSKYSLFIVILGIINIKIIYLSWLAQFYVIFLLAAFSLVNATMRHIIIYAFILKHNYNTFNMFVLVI